MELRTLQYFLAVAQEENISRAAETLHLTQPTLSRQMMDLEEELGRQLLIRGKRRVTLSDEGMLLRKRAAEMLDLMEKTRSELQANSRDVAGDVYLGSGESEGVRLLARVAREVMEIHPGVRIHIASGDAMDISERLEKGLIDFAIFIRNEPPEKYECIKLPIRDVWGALMPKDHPLCDKAAVEPRDLWDQPLILSRQVFQQSSAASPLVQWLGKRLDEVRVAGTYNLIYNASLLVEEGVGIALGLDKLIDTGGSRPLVFRPLAPDLTVDIYVAWKRYQFFSPAAGKFLEQLQKDFSKA